MDKIRLAALEAVLKLYRDPERLVETLPTMRYFTRSKAEIRDAASRLHGPVAVEIGHAFTVEIIDCTSQIGSGALPLETLASSGLAIAPVHRKSAGRSIEGLISAFRSLPVPVIGHIKDGALVLDLRCLDDEAAFLAQLPQLRAHLAGLPLGANTAAP